MADPVVTEVAAGSGLLVPGLFDHYESFEPRPAAFFGVPVVRRPGGGLATVAGRWFRRQRRLPARTGSPIPWAPPDLHLTGLEGAGEVQTPLTGPGARMLQIGDWVWFRHAKSGELAEHTNQVHLLAGDAIVDTRAVLPRPRTGLVSPAAAPDSAGLLALALDRPPTLGSGRLVCLDGPAGSGKTTWAAGIADLAPDAQVVHMDDLYAGWSGLPEVDAQLDGLLLPLAEGRPGCYRRYDWLAGEFAEGVVVDPVPLLVLEGVGSGASRFADAASRCWSGSRRRTTCGWSAAWPATATPSHRTGSSGPRTRPSCSRASRPASGPTSRRRRRALPGRRRPAGSWSSASWSGTRHARRPQRAGRVLRVDVERRLVEPASR